MCPTGAAYAERGALLRDRIQQIPITPPSTTSLAGCHTLNMLAAADALLIPLQCEYYALEGLSQL